MSTDAEYVKIANEAWTEAVALAELKEGWKEEKEDKASGDIVESRKKDNGKKIYRCRAKINIPAKLLIDAITDTDKVTGWNKTLTEAKVLKTINNEVAITYQVTSDGGGGMVSARDFVYVSKKAYKGAVFVMGGRSVEFKEAPSSSKIVRAVNGAGCQMVSPTEDPNVVELLWLMDCDYKGWMPQRVLDIAMPIAQTQFIDCVRDLAKKLKSEGKF